jgi:hypothetical protein
MAQRSTYWKTLSLIDTRYSDERRYVSFNRQTDDWGKLTGLLTLTITGPRSAQRLFRQVD